MSNFVITEKGDSIKVFVDVNGDGKADYCREKNKRILCSLAADQGFKEHQELPIKDLGQPNSIRQFIDIDGDGRADFCRKVLVGREDRILCALANEGFKKDFSYIQGPYDFGYDGSAVLTDVNGDGKVDYCRYVGDNPVVISCDLGKDKALKNKHLSHRQGLHISKVGHAEKIVIQKSAQIDSYITGNTELAKCRSVILNFTPVNNNQAQEDTIDLTNFGCISKISFKTLQNAGRDSSIDGQENFKISAIRIEDQENYVACIYNFDADNFKSANILLEDIVVLSGNGECLNPQWHYEL